MSNKKISEVLLNGMNSKDSNILGDSLEYLATGDTYLFQSNECLSWTEIINFMERLMLALPPAFKHWNNQDVFVKNSFGFLLSRRYITREVIFESITVSQFIELACAIKVPRPNYHKYKIKVVIINDILKTVWSPTQNKFITMDEVHYLNGN